MREDWDIPRLLAWYRYCEEHPPLQQMVQGYLGVKPVKRSKPEDAENAAKLIGDLMKMQGAVAVPSIEKR